MDKKKGLLKVGGLFFYYGGLSFVCYVAKIGGFSDQGWLIPFLLLYTYVFLYEILCRVAQDAVDFERRQKIFDETLLRAKNEVMCVTPFVYSVVVILFCGAVELIDGFEKVNFGVPLLLLLTYCVMLWMIYGVEDKIQNIESRNGLKSVQSIYKTARVISVAYVIMIGCMFFYRVVGFFAFLLFITHGVLSFHINVLASRVDVLRFRVHSVKECDGIEGGNDCVSPPV